MYLIYTLCIIDSFFLKFEAIYWDFLKYSNKRLKIWPSQLKVLENVFIAIAYKYSYFNNLKVFFFSLKQNYSHLFRSLLCYQRIAYLINTHQLALHALYFTLMENHQNYHLWIDSMMLPVCENQYIGRYKSMKVLATRGKSSMG